MQNVGYKDIDRAEWSALVQANATGTWFQTPEAYEFYASQPELFRPFVVAVMREELRAESQELRAVCGGYVTVEKNAVKQFFTRRAIIIGGPCLADDCTNEEVEALMKAVRKQLQSQAIYIETRNFNDYSRWKSAFAKAGFEYQPHLNFHVDCTSEEVIMQNLDRGRKRNISSSIKQGCVMVKHPTIEQVRDYYQIQLQLYKTKIKTPLFPLSFFEKLYEMENGRFFLIEHEGKIIGGTACVILPNKAIYEWFGCGMDGIIKGVYPSSLSTYQGMIYAANNSIPRLDMMGAGVPGDKYGVRDFKSRFGGKEVEYGRFLCITKPLLYKIGVLGVKILKAIK